MTTPLRIPLVALRRSTALAEVEAVTSEIALRVPRPPAVGESASPPPAEAGRLARWRGALGARRPGRRVPVVVAPAPTGPPWTAWAALVVCVAGFVGLVLPVLEIGGLVSVALFDVPWLGHGLAATFLVLTLLPVVDVARGRVQWTAWLLLPGLLGLVPTGLLFFALASLPRALKWVWEAIPDKAVEVGAASTTLFGADVALVVVAVAAIVVRIRLRWSRRAHEVEV